MDFYPPLNIDKVFDESVNEKAIAKFGFASSLGKNFIQSQNKNVYFYNNQITKSKSHYNVEHKLRAKINQKSSINNSSSSSLNEHGSKSKHSQNQPTKILRKLGQNERIFHGPNDKSRSYIFRTVIITSEIDLYNNIDLVYDSIEQWKSIHPLLRCRVTTLPDMFNESANLTKEKYFSYATNAKLKSMDNVEFLYYNSNCSTKQCEDIWKLLVERETSLSLDGENGLLWRLTFFQIKNVSKTEGFSYAVILTFDHSIMDGRSSYTSLLQLFSIIEDLYTNSFKKQKENSLLPCKEDIYKDRLSDHSKAQTTEYLKAPDFLDIENAHKSSYVRLKYLTPDEEAYGMIYTFDNKPFLSIKSLIEMSKGNNSKFRTLIVHKAELTKLLKKCKENGVKLTTFLNMSIILALRMIYERFESEYFLQSEPVINYTTNISLREFPEYKNYSSDKNGSIGCYIGLSLNRFEESFRYNSPNWVNDFWTKAHRESEVFHEKLDKGEFIHSIHLPSRKKEKMNFLPLW